MLVANCAYPCVITEVARNVRERERCKRIWYGHGLLSRAQDSQFLGVEQRGKPLYVYFRVGPVPVSVWNQTTRKEVWVKQTHGNRSCLAASTQRPTSPG